MQVLEPLLGSLNCERVLMFIFAREEGYPREIARFFNTNLDPIRKQLDKLETGGVLASRAAGRTRLYGFNLRYPFLKELKGLLKKALSFYTQEEQAKLLMVRREIERWSRREGKLKEFQKIRKLLVQEKTVKK